MKKSTLATFFLGLSLIMFFLGMITAHLAHAESQQGAKVYLKLSDETNQSVTEKFKDDEF